MNDQKRLLVLDLDGTVMTGDLRISPAVVDAISQATDQGIIVTIATGRVYSSAVRFLPALGINQPIATFQGAVVTDPVSGEVIHQAHLPGEAAAEAVSALDELGIPALAFHGPYTWVDRPSPELDLYLSYHPGEDGVRQTPDLVRFVRENPPVKLLFSAIPDELDSIIARLAERLGDQASVFRTHHHFGEITPHGIHKGSAIIQLAQHFDIPRESVVVIGDEANDLPMIEWAGLGLAMANAPQEVRERADAVVPSIEDDGVAWAIRHYLLEPDNS